MSILLFSAQKFSFYIENVTPIDANFLIETTNFPPCIDTETNMMSAISMVYPDTVCECDNIFSSFLLFSLSILEHFVFLFNYNEGKEIQSVR